MALLLGGGLLRCVVERKQVPFRLMRVSAKIERECWVFISTYGPGSESEEEIKEFWSELSQRVGSCGRNESVWRKS